MKKIVSALLIFIMMLSFVACGGNPDADENLGDDLVTVDPEKPADSDENTEIDGETPDEGGDVTDPADPDQPTDTLDGGSSEPYDPQPDDEPQFTMEEVLSFLPALPFSGFSGGHEGGNIYEYSVIGLNTGGATNPPDSGEPDGKDKDIFLAWLATLPSYGLSVDETGAGYQWTAADAYGNFVTFMIGDGGLFITVEKGETVTPQQPSGGEDTPSQGGTVEVTLPTLPYGEWVRKDVSSTKYQLVGTNVDEWEMCEVFVADLYAEGYNVFEIFYDPALAYEYQAEKGTANGVIIINIQGDIPNHNAVITVSQQ